MGSEAGARVAVAAMLLMVALASLTGCSTSNPHDAPVPAPAPMERGSTSTPDGSPTETTRPREPRATRYRPYPTEIDGAAKRTAARAIEALPDVRRVTYTQYFGYLPPKASILVEADFANGGGTTYDVRISKTRDGWRTDQIIAPTASPPLQDPGPLIRRVLSNDRITLPWAGRIDVAAGLVSDAVLRSMLTVARRHRIGISVLISAHPVHVFGTDRRSNHPDGLAYDIGTIDGRLVVDPAAAGPVRQVMRIAAGTGADQVGGPDDLDLDGRQYFSDPTHSDHVHVGFSG
ncbi:MULTISPECIES: hypothetical protein [Nocardioides]|uniref:Extensin-like C-terminal domain-containing protein n=1 Tax=Nocardioides vastitatis TaxID=2568655 RepID=A0ABW0ZGE9_9ACTN|nr:hypothetical protein [Nocardioides sp.]THI90838.1 hypothetical protein E7Z54_22610 [Nocardioides sp.]